MRGGNNHVDLDVLDPARAVYVFAAARLAELLRELSADTDVVGLGFAEHMPWNAIHLKSMLAEIPILNG